MSQRKCDSCGELLPPVDDAFCTYCQAAIGEDGYIRDQPTVSSFVEPADHDTGAGDFGHTASKRGPKIYKVPRKFDLAMIFVITFAYAAAFGLMAALNVDMLFQVTLMMLFSLVGLIQMFAPDRTARTASVLTGVFCMAIMFSAMLATNGIPDPTQLVLSILCSVLGFGSLIGYCTGVLVGSIFMMTEYVRRYIG